MWIKDKKTEKHNIYLKVIELWNQFCELHYQLYDLTCEEYSLLLSSDIDALENTLVDKEKLIDEIGICEKNRKELISEINHHLLPENQIKTVKDLIVVMEKYEYSNGQNHLYRYNALLIDIIEKIKAQNKKNQIFLNKSILSLKEIREGLSGGEAFKMYNNQGLSQNRTILK